MNLKNIQFEKDTKLNFYEVVTKIYKYDDSYWKWWFFFSRSQYVTVRAKPL